MKTTIILLLALGLFFSHADALRCRRSSCTGLRTCTSSTVTCTGDADHCFVMMESSPMVTLIRGCTTEKNCAIMKIYKPSTRCCTTDLCN